MCNKAIPADSNPGVVAAFDNSYFLLPTSALVSTDLPIQVALAAGPPDRPNAAFLPSILAFCRRLD